jgi:hypothetical protein
MKQPLNPKQSFSSDKIKIILVVVFLGVLLLTFGILLGLLLRQSGFQFSLSAIQTDATPTSSFASIAPTLFVPTSDCGSPTLVLGTSTLQIQNLTPAANGSLTVPPDTSGIAYWVEGTDHNYVFLLSPTPENLSIMSTITVGSTAKATWKNCNSTTYSLSAPQPGSFNGSALPVQSVDGITIFFQTDASGAGVVFKGELTEEQIGTINTPASGGSDVQAEIGLLETTTSADVTTISIGVSIYNWGQSAFTLSASDVSLTQPDGTVLVMKSSKPRLPEEIKPGETETIEFTFPHPSSQSATLKIFTVEYDIEGY